jgi:hypothetical protein
LKILRDIEIEIEIEVEIKNNSYGETASESESEIWVDDFGRKILSRGLRVWS